MGELVSLVVYEDCLEVCHVGLVVGSNYVWCLAIVVMCLCDLDK